MRTKRITAILFAFLAAALYAISIPVSKIILKEIPATLMAALLYLGAGAGMALFGFLYTKRSKLKKEKHLTKKEIPFISRMVLLDIAAPIFLMIGLSLTTAVNASLLNNFEIVATSLIALFFFRENISKRLWAAIILVTTASILLSIEDLSSLSITIGSVFVLLACICWGVENNCTRKLSFKDPLEIVVIKGFGSGLGSLFIAFLLHERSNNIIFITATLVLGFISFGLSIYFYVYAQRYLGAAKTSTYYAVAPFIGVLFSMVILKEKPTFIFVIALCIMLAGTYFASLDTLKSN